MNDIRRRIFGRREHIGERAAHQRRRIVEQHGHRAFGGETVAVGHVGVEVGAGERAGGFGADAGGGGVQPLQELTNDHGLTTATAGTERTLGAEI